MTESPTPETTTTRSPITRGVAATAIAASALGGLAAGATLFAPGLAGAQDDTEAPTEEAPVRPDFATSVAEALQPLVDDGTISADAVDDITEALEAARPERHHHRGFGGGADIAGVLGMEPDDLRAALADGQTIADVAEAQGVPVDEVVDAIVDAAEERVATALENDRIDQERADEILAGAEEKANEIVNGEFERQRGPRFGGRGFGPGAAPDDAPADGEA